jgi:rhomboid family GlyGly-CTERM serine protease
MGLRQGQVIAVVLLVAVLGLFGDTARELLAFDRDALAGWQLWRLVSGHFVHLGRSHLVLNLAGLGLVWYLVGQPYSGHEWLLVWAVSITAVSAGLWILEPELGWYVGLSGVLHGLLAAGILGTRHKGPEIWALAVALVGKLAWEQFIGPLPGSEAASGGTVIVNAHLYGAIGGVLAAILIRVRAKASI